MSARPYLLLGESDRGLIAQRVAAALAAWGGEWLAHGAPEPALAAQTRPQAERWLAAQAGAAQVLLGWRSGWLAQLGALLTLQPAHDARAAAPALAVKVGEAMLEALALQLLGAFSVAAPPQMHWDAEGTPEAWLAPGAGAAVYGLAPALPLVLALSPGLVAASLPKTRPGRAGREPLCVLARAVEACPVELAAVVGDAELELGELARLAAGDVIVLDRKLDEPLALRLGGEPVGLIHLGTAAGGKAAQIVAAARN